MRLIAPALLLAVTACAPQDGIDYYADNIAAPASEDEAVNIAGLEDESQPEVTNAAMDAGELWPPAMIRALTGRCSIDSWASGPLIASGRRQRLGCTTVAITYLERRPGTIDTMVQILKLDVAARIQLNAVWVSEERLTIDSVTLGEGEAVVIRGECRGHFVRPPESYFANSRKGVLEIDTGSDHDEPEDAKLDCTLSDLQGNPIGAISFSTR